jgi:thiamine-phosphate pyrophosphorylase
VPSFPAVYPILDVELVHARNLVEVDLARIWLDAGVTLFQLRAKRLASAPLLALVEALAREAHSRGARLVVNDRADLAVLGSADGVHVGQTDLSASDARCIVGPSFLIGLSTHGQEQLLRALEEPVDYVAIGPVFGTMSKAEPDPAVGVAGVARAAVVSRAAARPLVAIGGITTETAPAVLAAGASSVAVISDLLAGDPAHRIREYLRLVS